MENAILSLIREGKKEVTGDRNSSLTAREVERFRNIRLEELQDRLYNHLQYRYDAFRDEFVDDFTKMLKETTGAKEIIVTMSHEDEVPIIDYIDPVSGKIHFFSNFTSSYYGEQCDMGTLGYELSHPKDNSFAEYVPKQEQAL